MGEIYRKANLCVYPIGSVNSDTKYALITFLKESMGKALYVYDNLDYERLVMEWFDKHCARLLNSINMENEIKNALEVVCSTLYKVETKSSSLRDLSGKLQYRIPPLLVCNDYLPVKLLVECLQSLDK